MSGRLAEREFEDAAEGTLSALARALGEVDGIETDLASGILTIEFPSGDTYVVNSHRAARQIWMAAERSAWHFDYDCGLRTWVATRTGDELWSALSRVLSAKLDRPLALAP